MANKPAVSTITLPTLRVYVYVCVRVSVEALLFEHSIIHIQYIREVRASRRSDLISCVLPVASLSRGAAESGAARPKYTSPAANQNF